MTRRLGVGIGRRDFVRYVAGAPLLALPLWGVGCTTDTEREGVPDPLDPRSKAATPLLTPELVPFEAGSVRIVEATSPPPLAYLSVGRQEIFVDAAHRDRVIGLLNAHISVSMGVWRVRLPGDPPTEPVPPGTPGREFEERPMTAWPSDDDPAEGDARFLRGTCGPLLLSIDCVPLADTAERVTVPLIEINAWKRPGRSICREDFVEVGRGVSHSDRECTDGGRPVRLLTWRGGS